MATTRTASAHWEGSLMEGAGQVSLESSGIGTYDVSWPARAEAANGKTSPEELIAAAHSTCYSMALSHGLAQAGTPPTHHEGEAHGHHSHLEDPLGRLADGGRRPGHPGVVRDRDLRRLVARALDGSGRLTLQSRRIAYCILEGQPPA